MCGHCDLQGYSVLNTQMNPDVEHMTLTVLFFISSAMFHLLNLCCWLPANIVNKNSWAHPCVLALHETVILCPYNKIIP